MAGRGLLRKWAGQMVPAPGPQPAGALGAIFFIVGSTRSHPVTRRSAALSTSSGAAVPTVRLSLSSRALSILQQRPVQLSTASSSPQPAAFRGRLWRLDPNEQDRTGSVLRLMHFSEQDILSVYPAESGVLISRLL